MTTFSTPTCPAHNGRPCLHVLSTARSRAAVMFIVTDWENHGHTTHINEGPQSMYTCFSVTKWADQTKQ